MSSWPRLVGRYDGRNGGDEEVSPKDYVYTLQWAWNGRARSYVVSSIEMGHEIAEQNNLFNYRSTF